MTIRISISCEPEEIDDVRRLLMGFVVYNLKPVNLLDQNGKISAAAEREILDRYDDGETIRDIAQDLGIDGRQVSGLVLGKRISPTSHHQRQKNAEAH